MSVVLKCPRKECGKACTVEQPKLGQAVRCPYCRMPFFPTPHDTPMGVQVSSRSSGSATPTSPTPQRIGRFEVRARLGAGGFGTVYRAYDLQMRREVALKVPNPGVLDEPGAVERLFREARAAGNLHHPHIVPVFEVGGEPPKCFIAFAFIDGQDLAELIREKQLSYREIARVAEQLAEALGYAHDQGIVHRDVKPQNVLMDGSGKAHLADFGLAHEHDQSRRLTMDGQLAGTPSYIAPERLRADDEMEQEQPASDQYSLGVLLYEMLTGQLPFSGPVEVVLYKAVHEQPVPPRQVRPSVPRDLETICLKCLSKDPNERYESCRALAHDLGRWRRGDVIRARPVGPLERIWRWCQREPALAVAVACALFFLVLGTGFSTYFAVAERFARWAADASATDAHDAAEEAKQARKTAEEKAKLAAEKAQEAAEKTEESQKRLARLYINTGMRLVGWQKATTGTVGGAVLPDANKHLRSERTWGAGDPMQALLWFHKAWETDPDPDNEPMHRLRIASVLEQFPKLVGLCLHREKVLDVVLDPNSKRVLVRVEGTAAYLWDPFRCRLIAPPLQHDGLVHHVTFSPDGKLACTSGRDGRVKLWDARDGRPTAKPLILPGPARHAAFSPDGKHLATACEDGVVRFFSLPDGKPTGTLAEKCKDGAMFVGFSGYGNRLVTWDGSRHARVWEVSSRKPLGKPIAHSPAIPSYLPQERQFPFLTVDGRRLLTVVKDTCALWDTDKGETVWKVSDRKQTIVTAVLSPNNRQVLVMYKGIIADLFQLSTRTRRTLPHTRNAVVGIFSPDGKKVVTTSTGGRVHFWDAQTGEALFAGHLHSSHIEHLAYSRDGRYLLCGSDNNTIHIHQTSSTSFRPRPTTQVTAGRPDHLPGMPSSLSDYAIKTYSKDGRQEIHFGKSEGARIVSREGATTGPITLPHKEIVRLAEFGAAGKQVVTVGEKQAHFWDLRTGERVGQALTLESRLQHIQFNADETRLLGIARNGKARVWDTASGDILLGPVPALTNGGSSISPNGRWVAITRRDFGYIGVYDVDSKQQLKFEKFGGFVWTGRFSPNSQRLLTMCSDNTARIWQMPDGKRLGPPLRHSTLIKDGAFGSEGRLVVTAASDGIHLWDAETGDLLAPPIDVPKLRAVWFGPGGRTIELMNSTGRSLQYQQINLSTFTTPREQVSRLVELLSSHLIDETAGVIPVGDDQVRSNLDAYRRAWLAWQGLADDPESQPDAFGSR